MTCILTLDCILFIVLQIVSCRLLQLRLPTKIPLQILTAKKDTFAVPPSICDGTAHWK